MPALKGPKAAPVTLRVAGLLELHYPPGLASIGIKAIPGGGVSVSPIMVGDDASSAASPLRRTFAQGVSEIEVVGDSAVFGFGTWIPFLPRSVRARLNAKAVTETLLEQIVAASEPPSPFANAMVGTEISSGEVRVTVMTPDDPTPVLSFGVPLTDCV